MRLTFVLLMCFAPSFGQKLNVLLLILDDFRPAIMEGYSDNNAVTKNIDSLVRKSSYFIRAYAQQALCAPSRNSFLTSRRPDTLKLYDFYSYWRHAVGNFTTLSQYFKENGYKALSIGKVFHPGKSSNFSDDFPYSWSHPTFHPSTEKYMNKPFCLDEKNGKWQKNVVCPVDLLFQPEKTLPDIESMLETKNTLKELYKKNLPFFLAVGFHKPHIPLKYPSKYLHFHPIDKFLKPDIDFRPAEVPPVSWNPFTDLRERDDVKMLNLTFPYGFLPKEFRMKTRQSYYAAVTYVDDLIGEIFTQINWNNTIIVLTSDHGWSLGEHTEWAKYSNYEVALRVPLIIYDPRRPQSMKIDRFVELLDLFPTLVDLAGLPSLKKCKKHTSSLTTQKTCTEGNSLVEYLFKNRQSKLKSKSKDSSFSQYPRPGLFPSWKPNSDKPRLNEIKIMGYTIRKRNFRYTAWIEFNHQSFQRNWNNISGEELYDHRFDSEEFENLALRCGFKNIKDRLKSELKSQFC